MFVPWGVLTAYRSFIIARSLTQQFWSTKLNILQGL